jgi:hypothetical protein
MNATVTKYKEQPELTGLAADVQGAVNTLAEMGIFFSTCAREGKFLVPVSHAYPFLMMMGKVVSSWLLLWQAGIAREKLAVLSKEKGVAPSDAVAWKEFIKNNRDAAFYSGKVAGARFFIKNILPEVDAAAKAIKSEDLSMVDIATESFA